MPEEPAKLDETMDAKPYEPPKADRSLTGLYVVMGVLSVLVAVFAFSWTPLRVWYWERETRSARGRDAMFLATQGGGASGAMPPKTQAARRLVRCGPAARPALVRLLSSPCPLTREAVLEACGYEKAAWTLPFVVDYAVRAEFTVVEKLGGYHDFQLSGDGRNAAAAVWAAQETSGERFHAEWAYVPADLPDARKKLLAWWEREGKAKCGEGQQ